MAKSEYIAFNFLLVISLALASCSTDYGISKNTNAAEISRQVHGKNHEKSVQQVFKEKIYLIETKRILGKAEVYLSTQPKTVTADIASRSQGGPHDFFSEGDYWWPDPENPEGPYNRRDGVSNPDNFIAHRLSLMAFSDITATLTSAFLLTSEAQYVDAALEHINAWFVNPDTRMNPSLLYGQAISGRHSGRSIGIIDTIHLVEVARSIEVLSARDQISPANLSQIKAWFAAYLHWLNTHEYGIKEKNHPNNHGITWSMQASAFARLVGDEDTLTWVRTQFKDVYLAQMMNQQGGFEAELARTKPYGYSLFVIDAMAGVAQLASTPDDSLWTYTLYDGRNLRRGLEFITPYVADKSSWPYAKDVQYWDEWPVRHISLFFAALEFGDSEYFDLYTKYEADPQTYEVIRNLPIRHPLIWFD